MLFLTAALMLTAVIGFLCGKEYDRMVRRANYNRRLRREQAEKLRREEMFRKQAAVEKKKFDFVYGVQWNAPRERSSY